MPWVNSPYTIAVLVAAVSGGVLLVLLGIFVYQAWRRSRVTPEERERRRREWLVAAGKICDAFLVEVRDHLVFYSYAVRGVEYTASQDTARLADKIPSDLSAIRSVTIRYDPRNPANSIVVAEEWSGLHAWPKAGSKVRL